jgi:NitT/TauT family transport system substrate-binding protein
MSHFFARGTAGRRIFLRTMVRGGVAAAALGSPLVRAQQGRRVRMGYIADFLGASMVAVANKQELWKKHGLVPETKIFTNGPIQIQALGTGDLDFGYIGPGALWLPMTGRAKLVAINAVGFSDRVIARSGIASIADLKGKTVAVPEGTSGDMLLRLALRNAGLRNEDIKRVTMDPSTVVSAFISKQVDAAGIWYPHVATIKARMPDLVELASNKDFMPKMSFPSAFVMRNELDGDANAALVSAVVRVIKEASDWRKNNLKDAVEITAAMLGAPKAGLETESAFAQYLSSQELAQYTRDGTVAGWLSGMNELFKDFGRVPEMADPAKYYLAARYLG